ncbi:MAG TPA: bifunctional UDP-2,4-diacetamido-2,4,6-trideoxy-beta-L-altropyranose hydrolase/GNAT family N-acetyltransferase [Nocardioides sp.]|nr:bifunctional UDP-2,4-diacetamido-2,4,6-trideoxy-beta-L-altropyranose hydrolase/GNAT family N-acetyltransferase [Nocardioides sp.]
MLILLHSNGGPALGIGHVMRSIALAEEALAAGHRVVLAGEIEGDFLRQQIDALPGLELVPVRRPADRALADLVRDLAPDVVHLDTYDVDVDPVSWDDRRRATPLLSNIEDGVFGRRGAGLVIDPSFGADAEPRGAADDAVLLRGSHYAPLRRSVSGKRGGWVARPRAEAVLVVMGGTDPMRMTGPVLELLGRTGLELRVTAIVSGAAADPCAAVVAAHPQLDVHLSPPMDDLPAAMVAQDLVISAAGTSVWELCCLGVPTALVCTVENQRVGYDGVVSAGAAIGLGSSGAQLLEQATVERLRGALQDDDVRRSLAGKASQIVDGLGAWRVVRAWEQLAPGAPSRPVGELPRVREADASDARSLWSWRNDPTTRAGSLQQDEIPFEDHLRWLTGTIERGDRLLLVAADASGDVGTVRWDRLADAEWEVSITVAPARRGESLSRGLLAAGERELLRRTGRPTTAIAQVQDSNPASRRLFEASGYVAHLPTDAAGVRTYARWLSTEATASR